VVARSLAAILLASTAAVAVFSGVLAIGRGVAVVPGAFVAGGVTGALVFTMVNDGPRALGWKPLDWVIAVVVVLGSVVAAMQVLAQVNMGDTTCGAVYRPWVWSSSPYCTQLMHARLFAAGSALVASALGAYVLALRVPRDARAR
jgi:hypothetical protein